MKWTGFAGAIGKRAWNSGFASGLGKRAWNSGFASGIGKRAWNSGFQGAVGKRSQLEDDEEDELEQLAPGNSLQLFSLASIIWCSKSLSNKICEFSIYNTFKLKIMFFDKKYIPHFMIKKMLMTKLFSCFLFSY